MSSEHRASSAVRNLRSIFENKASLDPNSPDSRGRSPSNRSSDKENGYQHSNTNKIRASFVPVEPVTKMASLEKQSSVDQRRGSFSEMNGDGELSELKKIVSEEQGNRLVPEGAVESAVGSTAVTPLKEGSESGGYLGHWNPSLRPNGTVQPENPDKPVTGAEEEPSDMQPADPSSESAVSGGDALPPVAEDLRSSTKPSSSTTGKKTNSKKPASDSKPAAISTKAATKATSSTVKSPATQPKTPSSAKAPSSTKTESPISTTLKEPLKKASRSSLTAPTAASTAHTKAASDKSSSSKSPPTSKAMPREVTKPVNLPSHLTAPTASSKAKHGTNPPPASTTSTFKASTTSRTKPTSSGKPAPRSSLPAQQRPASRESNTTGRRSLAPADSSFLERMMKPTAASSSKTHEKVEAKSPQRTKATTPKPKMNGTASKSTRKPPGPSKTAPSEPEEEAAGESSIEPTGNETPISHANGTANEALEATPAGLGGDETIR